MDCRIERIEISSFGKLKNVSLDCSQGINLLFAPNESGKSTLAAFLRYVLYGFTDGRKQALAENDRKLYTPWDQPRAEGTLYLRGDGTLYKIFRSCSGTKEQLEVTDAATGKPLPEITVPGKVLLGVSEEVFSRTLFFRQALLPQNRDDVLAEQLQNLAVSADEQMGSAKAMDKLSKAKNALRGRAGAGILPKLEQESVRLGGALAEALEENEKLNGLRAEANKASERLEENRIHREWLEREKQDLERFEAKQKADRLNALKADAEAARENYLEAAQKIRMSGKDDSARISALISKNASRIALKSRSDDLASQSERVCAELAVSASSLNAAQAQKAKKERSVSALLFLFSCLIAVGCAVGSLLVGMPVRAVLYGVAAAALAVSVFFLFRRARVPKRYGFSSAAALTEAIASLPAREEKQTKLRERLAELRSQRDLLAVQEKELREEVEGGLLSYLGTLGEDYGEQLQELLNDCNRVAELKVRAEAAQNAFRTASAEVDFESLAALAADAPATVRERQQVEREEAFYRTQGEMFADKKQAIAVQFASLEARVADPALLAGKKRAVDARIAEYGAKLRSYETARAGIEEAADRMKSMVAPRISSLAGSYFSASTDGKYRALNVDTRLSMNTEDGGMTRDCDYLSAGTKDLAYLSLRLALADLLFGGNGVPMVLDDTFGHLDDERLSAALALLSEEAKRHQLLLFTCTDREERLMKKLQIPYHTLAMKG